MKRLALALLAVIAVTSCKQKATEQSTSKTDHINRYVKNVVDSSSYYRYINSNADSTRQVSVIYRKDKPVMITTTSGVMLDDELYILSDKDDRVVYMHEVITDPNGYERRENQFFYDDNRVLLAQTKTDTGWIAYRTYDSLNDYRLQCPLLNAKVTSLILDTERDRPRLNAAGNAARRQGALYWVEGDKPYWSVMVTPNDKIVVVLNNGAERYEYPVFSSEKLDEFMTSYHGVGEDGHSFELVLSDITQQSTDSATKKVNAKLTHKGDVFEGIAVNLMDF